jgi:hypothetical protein
MASEQAVEALNNAKLATKAQQKVRVSLHVPEACSRCPVSSELRAAAAPAVFLLLLSCRCST